MPSVVSQVASASLPVAGALADAPALPEEIRHTVLARMLESAPVLAAVFRLSDLKLAYLNAAGAERLNPDERADLAGLRLPDLIGLSFLEQLGTEILPKSKDRGYWRGECELRDVWGSEFMVSAVFEIQRPRAGEVAHEEYLCLHAQEMPTACSMQQTHFTDRALLHALLDSLPDSIYFKDQKSRFVRVNRAQAARFGLSDPAAAIGKTDFDFFSAPHAGAAQEDEKMILSTGQPILDLEEMETWEDGHVSWVATTKLPLYSAAGEPIGTFGISRDITARKLAEKEHREMEVQLQLAQKLESIGRLAAGVAHEVNTPTQFIADNTHFLTEAFAKLASILDSHRALRTAAATHADCEPAIQAVLAAESAAELDYLATEVPRCLEQSLDGLARVARIVRSLKEFAHPNSPDLIPADLNRVIETALAVSRHEWKYVAEVVTELDPDLPPVPCVVDEFNQVILNLVINAAHAIGDALKLTGQERGKITVRTRLEGSWAVVEVEDTGTGIPPEIRQRVFEPFFTTKAAGKGTGQGLAIVQAIMVKSHRGTIDLRTEPGRGTTFVLRLPLTAPATVQQASPVVSAS